MADTVREFAAREPRYRIRDGADVQVTIKTSHDGVERELIGNVSDLSRGGAKIGLEECIPMGGEFTFCMDVPELDLHLEVDSGVRWVRPAEDEGWLIGCSFEPRFPGQALAELACGGVLERRSSQRIPASLRTTALWELSQDETEVFLMDLSGGGCCLLSEVSRGIGERLIVHAVDQDGKKTPTRARVCWRMKTDDGFWIGCSFMDSDTARRLTESAYRQERPQEVVTSPRLPVYLGVTAIALSLILTFAALRIERSRPASIPAGTTAGVARPDSADDPELSGSQSVQHNTPPVAIVAPDLPEINAVPVPAPEETPPVSVVAPTLPGSDATPPIAIEAPPLPGDEWPAEDRGIESPQLSLTPDSPNRDESPNTLLSPETDQQTVPLADLPRTETPEKVEPAHPGWETTDEVHGFGGNLSPRPTVIQRDTRNTVARDAWTSRSFDPFELQQSPLPRTLGPRHRRVGEPAVLQLTVPGSQSPDRVPVSSADNRPSPVEVIVEPRRTPPTFSSPITRPESKTPRRNTAAAEMRFQAGVEALDGRRYEEAIDALEQAIGFDSSNALYPYFVAVALYHLDRVEEAEQFVHRAAVMERDEPVDRWGFRMQRVQGRVRVWLETTRAIAASD